MSVVLDASAILALVKGEAGTDRVAAVLADAAVSAVNQAEVVSHFTHLGAPIADIRTMLGALPYRVVAADDALSWEAGRLRSVTAAAGLSLGDRFCLALAAREAVPAYTADRAWATIADAVGVTVTVIR